MESQRCPQDGSSPTTRSRQPGSFPPCHREQEHHGTYLLFKSVLKTDGGDTAATDLQTALQTAPLCRARARELAGFEGPLSGNI